MLRTLVVALCLVSFAGPAMAESYYAVIDTKKKKCRILDEDPGRKRFTVIGTGAYGTEQEANKARKMSNECRAFKGLPPRKVKGAATPAPAAVPAPAQNGSDAPPKQ